MGAFEVTPAGEGRHTPGPEGLWGESWYLDFAASDTTYGGYVRLGLYPPLGRSWLWIHLVGRDRPLVAVCDHQLPCPAGDAIEVSADGAHVAIGTSEPWQRCRGTAQGTGGLIRDPARGCDGSGKLA